MMRRILLLVTVALVMAVMTAGPVQAAHFFSLDAGHCVMQHVTPGGQHVKRVVALQVCEATL